MNRRFALASMGILMAAGSAFAGLITAVPGPDDQGGMLMPMVSITGADNPTNPSTGTISVSFNPSSIPVLRPLEEWSAGSWFAADAAWRPDLGSPEGVGGTPAANAGAGDLFNNQYGFMFMSNPMMGMAFVPTGKSLAIRLTSISDSTLASFNYVNSQNRWDPVFDGASPQVLWNGSMWHNYFTLPTDATPGTYTAEFEIFIADAVFTSGTGFADYSNNARTASKDLAFQSALVTYQFHVVPEPGAVVLGMLAALVTAVGVRMRRRR